eukprot:1061519-Pelagomonas_calceolata.AAC.8
MYNFNEATTSQDQKRESFVAQQEHAAKLAGPSKYLVQAGCVTQVHNVKGILEVAASNLLARLALHATRPT